MPGGPAQLAVMVRPMRIMLKNHRYLRYYSLRRTNLGEITEYLINDGVPNFLQRSIKDSYLDEHIKLRLLPTTHPYMPILQGRTKYKASLNAIRLITNNLILKKKCLLHINSVTTLLKDKEESLLKAKHYNCITQNDKLVIKWQSCSLDEGYNHAIDNGKVTSIPELNLSNGSPPPVIDYILHPSTKPFSGEMVSAHIDHHDASAQRNPNNSVSRIVKGIFIFEFNEENTQIVVHTIENVEMIDFDKKIETGDTGALAC